VVGGGGVGGRHFFVSPESARLVFLVLKEVEFLCRVMGSRKKTANLPATGSGKRYTLKRRQRGGAEAATLLKQPNVTESLVEPANEESLSGENQNLNNTLSQERIENQEINNQNTDFTYDEEQDSQVEEEGSNLHRILRIGVDGKSEYISLDNMPINKGGFNQYRIGNGTSILKNMYGIDVAKDKDALNAMITAFGVDNLDQLPPLAKYMKEQCQFDGMNLVIRALKRRQFTLSNKIKMLSGTTQRREQELLKWIGTTIQALESVRPNAKVCEPPTKKTYSLTLPGMPNMSKISVSSFQKGCPCLEEMSLLRDLVVVVSMLMGIANEDVKQQLENIPIQNLLETLKGSDKKAARGKLDEVLETLLLALQSAEKRGDGNGVPMEQLRIIYDALQPEEPKEDVTVDDILSEIRQKLYLLEQRGQAIQNAQTKEGELRQLMDEKEAVEQELEELRAYIQEIEEAQKTDAQQRDEMAQQMMAQFQEQYAQLDQMRRNNISKAKSDSDSRIQALTVEKEAAEKQMDDSLTFLQGQFDQREAELETEIGGLKAEIERLKQSAVDSSAASQGAEAAHQQALDQLQQQLVALEQQKRDAEEAHQQALDQLRAENAAATAEMETRLAALSVDKQGLEDAVASKEAEITGLKGQLQEATDSLVRQGATSEEQQRAAQAQVDEIRKNLTTLEAQRDSLAQTTIDQGAELAALRSELEAKTARIAELEARIQSMAADHAAAITAAEKAKEEALKDLGGEMTDALEKLREELASTKDALKQCESEKEIQATESSEQAAETARATAAEKERLEKELAALKAAQEQLQEQLDAKGGSESELQRQLATAKERIQELERQIQGATNATFVKEQQIAELQQKLAHAEQEKTQIQRNLNAERGAKPNELAAAKREGAEQQMTADQEALNAQERDCDEKIRQLQSQLEQAKKELADSQQSMQGQVADLQRELQQARENSSRKNGEIHDLKQSLEAAEAVTSAAKTGATQRNTEQKAEIQRLQGELDTKTAQLAQKTQTMAEDTQRRLNTLITTLALNEDMITTAKAYMSGDDSQLTKIQGEVCSFFRYLFDTIHLQLRQIDSSSFLNADEKYDIFNIFLGISYTDNSYLLNELTLLFQELFQKIGRLGDIQSGLQTGKNYPTLNKILREYMITQNNPLKRKSGFASGLIKELNTFRFLSSFGIVPNSDVMSFTIRKQQGIEGDDTKHEFINNTTHFTPLSILAIKMIQMLAHEFYAKYGLLTSKCGISLGQEPTLAQIQTQYGRSAAATSVSTIQQSFAGQSVDLKNSVLMKQLATAATILANLTKEAGEFQIMPENTLRTYITKWNPYDLTTRNLTPEQKEEIWKKQRENLILALEVFFDKKLSFPPGKDGYQKGGIIKKLNDFITDPDLQDRKRGLIKKLN
jgi:chromosome segregation ATPase